MNEDEDVKSKKTSKMIRAGAQIIGGAIPFAGGLFSAAAGHWSEQEQEKVNSFFQAWIRMLEDEIKEKEQTILEIIARLDIQDEAIISRLESKEYQSLLKKTFREWNVAESEEKRTFIRNVLANAAASSTTSDDVVRLFVDWINKYSEFHFQVIGAIYNSRGISRGEVWDKIGRGSVREDSADADLYKLLFRDLSTGGIMRQHREVDYQGNFVKRKTGRKHSSGSQVMKSAFDREEKYELTQLGQQFIHYAMTDLPLKLEYNPEESE